MTNPSLFISNGPSRRALEMAFISRDLGALATFTIIVNGNKPLEVGMRILNFQYATYSGWVYNLGGHLPNVTAGERNLLPPFKFTFAKYDAGTRQGILEFTNGE